MTRSLDCLTQTRTERAPSSAFGLVEGRVWRFRRPYGCQPPYHRGMTATIWARRVGSSRDLESGEYAVDPTDDDDLERVGRKIAKRHGVKPGDLQLEVRGGPRSKKLVV